MTHVAYVTRECLLGLAVKLHQMQQTDGQTLRLRLLAFVYIWVL